MVFRKKTTLDICDETAVSVPKNVTSVPNSVLGFYETLCGCETVYTGDVFENIYMFKFFVV